MKRMIFFLALIGAAFILAGCAGAPAPADSGGDIQLDEQNLSSEGSGSLSAAYESTDFVPRVNPDGSLTMFSIDDQPVRTMPMTDTRSKGALNRKIQEYDEQIKNYLNTVAANPEDYKTCIRLAGLYIDRGMPGDIDEAIKYSNMALAVNGNDAHALYTRGLSYAEKGENEKALSDLRGVLGLSLQSVKGVHYLMGQIYYKENNIDEAIDAFEKVAVFDPEFADVEEILQALYASK